MREAKWAKARLARFSGPFRARISFSLAPSFSKANRSFSIMGMSNFFSALIWLFVRPSRALYMQAWAAFPRMGSAKTENALSPSSTNCISIKSATSNNDTKRSSRFAFRAACFSSRDSTTEMRKSVHRSTLKPRCFRSWDEMAVGKSLPCSICSGAKVVRASCSSLEAKSLLPWLNAKLSSLMGLQQAKQSSLVLPDREWRDHPQCIVPHLDARRRN